MLKGVKGVLKAFKGVKGVLKAFKGKTLGIVAIPTLYTAVSPTFLGNPVPHHRYMPRDGTMLLHE